MLSNIEHDTPAEHRRLLVAGVVNILVVGVLIWLSVAVYNKVFERVDLVTVRADRAGLQLNTFGDVRRYGALVGQVREVEQDGEEAVITLALEPGTVDDLPANLEVDIVPTTLFGQKFVALRNPDRPEGTLEAGAVIPAERVTTNVELNAVLTDLFPLLRAVRPADLNMTLSALANALDGRGEQLGATLDRLGDLLSDLEPELPTVREDLQGLSDVARIYDDAAPDLLDTLRNATVTFRTVRDERAALDTFFSDLTDLSASTERVLATSEADLIELGDVSTPVLRLLARYSPEFSCLIRGAANYTPILDKTFEGGGARQFYSFGARQYEPYEEDDRPRYGTDRGPRCLTLPGFPETIAPAQVDNGTDIDENRGRYTPIPVLISPDTILEQLLDPLEDMLGRTGSTSRSSASGASLFTGASSRSAGGAEEQRLLAALLNDRSGGAASHQGLGSLILGPLVRGVVSDGR